MVTLRGRENAGQPQPPSNPSGAERALQQEQPQTQGASHLRREHQSSRASHVRRANPTENERCYFI